MASHTGTCQYRPRSRSNCGDHPAHCFSSCGSRSTAKSNRPSTDARATIASAAQNEYWWAQSVVFSLRLSVAGFGPAPLPLSQ
jgi:hypothetical protein